MRVLPFIFLMFLFANVTNTFIAGQSSGSIDENFGNNGEVYKEFDTNNPLETGLSMALQPDGKILVGMQKGYSQNEFKGAKIVRFNSDGSIDENFGNKGEVYKEFDTNNPLETGLSMALQPDGKILVGMQKGYSQNEFKGAKIVRFNSDGSIDENFGNKGEVYKEFDTNNPLETGLSMALQPDGKILVGMQMGYSQNEFKGAKIVRFNSDGSIDENFGNNGEVYKEFDTNNPLETGLSMALQPDGKILVGMQMGYSQNEFKGAKIVRFNSDGSIDENFGNNGEVYKEFDTNNPLETGLSMALQPDGKILVGMQMGYSQNEFKGAKIVRFNSDGSIDENFGNNGEVYKEFDTNNPLETGLSMALQPDGKILVGMQKGYSQNEFKGAKIVCFNSDGSIDENFGNNGEVYKEFDTNNPLETGLSMALQPDGKILVGMQKGYSQNQIKAAKIVRLFLDQVNYNLSITMTGNGNGLVKVNSNDQTLPYQGSFNAGVSVELEAISVYNSEFTSWGGKLAGSNNPETITMNEDKNISANFELITSINVLRCIETRQNYSFQSHPNPFSQSTQLYFSLITPSKVSILVYNQFGNIVYRLIDALDMNIGTFKIDWTGINNNGYSLPSGIYFAKISIMPYENSVQYFSQIIKLLIIR